MSFRKRAVMVDYVHVWFTTLVRHSVRYFGGSRTLCAVGRLVAGRIFLPDTSSDLVGPCRAENLPSGKRVYGPVPSASPDSPPGVTSIPGNRDCGVYIGSSQIRGRVRGPSGRCKITAKVSELFSSELSRVPFEFL